MKKMSFNEFTNEQINEALMSVDTCLICKVLEVDMNLLKADVLPLHDPEATPILDVPIAFHQTDNFLIQVPYKKDDIVLVVCAQADIDPLLFGGGNAASRSFDRNDALIVGGVNFFTKPIDIPKEHEESLLICRKDFKSRIEIDKDGKIIVETDQDIDVKSEQNINFDAPNGTFKVRAKIIDMQEV